MDKQKTEGASEQLKDASKVRSNVEELRAERRTKVKALMDGQDLTVADVVNRLQVPENERETWKRFLYGIRSNSPSMSVPIERAQALAPVLGVDPMTILVKYTEREKSRLRTQNYDRHHSVVPAPTIPVISADELKRKRAGALDALMKDRGLTATQLANQIESDDYRASLLAMQIADARADGKPLNDDLAKKIVDLMHTDPAAFCIPDTRQEPPPRPRRQQRHKTGRRRAGRERREAERASEEAEAAVSPAEETVSLDLGGDEMERLFAEAGVRLVRTQEGEYVLRAETHLTSNEALHLLFHHLKN